MSKRNTRNRRTDTADLVLVVVEDKCEHGVELSADHPRAVPPGLFYDPACTVRVRGRDHMRPHQITAPAA